MAKNPIAAKVQKATTILGVANLLAAFAFLFGYFMSKEWLFLVASGAMFVAFGGIIVLAIKMKKKLADFE